MKLRRRRFLYLAAGTAALPIASPVAVLAQGAIAPAGALRIVERTQYYAKPGLAAEVLDIRRKASAVRVSIGLPAGEILVKHPAATAASRMSLRNAPSPTWPHATPTSPRAPPARKSRAFACR